MKSTFWDVALFAVLVLAALAHVHGAMLAPSERETPHVTPARAEEGAVDVNGPAFGVFIRPATELREEGGTTRV
jgi:hypothetical protein